MSEYELGCVVMSVRVDKESIVLDFEGKTAVIELSGITTKRCKATVRAPRDVRIFRKSRKEDAHDPV